MTALEKAKRQLCQVCKGIPLPIDCDRYPCWRIAIIDRAVAAELEGQSVTENPDVQRLIIQLEQYKARIEKATAKLNDYFVITPRDRNKSDELIGEAKAALAKGDTNEQED